MSLLSIKFTEHGLPKSFTNVKPSLLEHNDDQIQQYLGDFIKEKTRPKTRSRGARQDQMKTIRRGTDRILYRIALKFPSSTTNTFNRFALRKSQKDECSLASSDPKL